jgi:hypothetical protein
VRSGRTPGALASARHRQTVGVRLRRSYHWILQGAREPLTAAMPRDRANLPAAVLIVLAGDAVATALIATAVLLLVEVSAALPGMFTLVSAVLLHRMLWQQ